MRRPGNTRIASMTGKPFEASVSATCNWTAVSVHTRRTRRVGRMGGSPDALLVKLLRASVAPCEPRQGSAPGLRPRHGSAAIQAGPGGPAWRAMPTPRMVPARRPRPRAVWPRDRATDERQSQHELDGMTNRRPVGSATARRIVGLFVRMGRERAAGLTDELAHTLVHWQMFWPESASTEPRPVLTMGFPICLWPFPMNFTDRLSPGPTSSSGHAGRFPRGSAEAHGAMSAQRSPASGRGQGNRH